MRVDVTFVYSHSIPWILCTCRMVRRRCVRAGEGKGGAVHWGRSEERRAQQAVLPVLQELVHLSAQLCEKLRT